MGYVKLNLLGRSVLPIEGDIVRRDGFTPTGSIEGKSIYRASEEPSLRRVLEAFSNPGDKIDIVYLNQATERLFGREAELSDRAVNFGNQRGKN